MTTTENKLTGIFLKTDEDIKLFLRNRFDQKNIIHKKRQDIINEHKRKIQEAREPAVTVASGLFSKDGIRYHSVLKTKPETTLMPIKMYPTHFSFASTRTNFEEEQATTVQHISEIHRYMRSEGGMEIAEANAKKDLIFGQSIIVMNMKQRIKDKQLINIQPEYKHVPFEMYRGKYGSTDEFWVQSYDPRSFYNEFGEDVLKKVTTGASVSNDLINGDSTSGQQHHDWNGDEKIEVVYYFDYAMKRMYCLMGGNGYVHMNLTGEDYPYVKEFDEGFSPFLIRNYYEPEATTDTATHASTQGYFGYGVYDLLMPLAEIDEMLNNAVFRESLVTSQFQPIIFSHDPISTKNLYQNQIMEKLAIPIFLKEGSKNAITGISEMRKPTNWQEFQVSQQVIFNLASLLTDLRLSAVGGAETASQDLQATQTQTAIGAKVLKTNAHRDKEFADNEVHYLKNTKSEFHKTRIQIKIKAKEIQRKLVGITDKVTESVASSLLISEILNKISSYEIKLMTTPLIEGIKEPAELAREEIEMKMIPLYQNYPKVTEKLLKKLAQRIPEAEIEDTDFLPPEPPRPPEMPPEQQEPLEPPEQQEQQQMSELPQMQPESKNIQVGKMGGNGTPLSFLSKAAKLGVGMQAKE